MHPSLPLRTNTGSLQRLAKDASFTVAKQSERSIGGTDPSDSLELHYALLLGCLCPMGAVGVGIG
jgi:hypothetical protein